MSNTLVLAGFGRGSGPNNGFINVSLVPVADRAKSQAQLINQTLGTPEVRIGIDRAKAADLGVRAGDVTHALNTMAAGQIVSSFSERSNQYDVVVRAQERFRRDRSGLTKFTVASSNGSPVPLDRAVKLEEGLRPSSISRLNRLRQVTVSAGPAA